MTASAALSPAYAHLSYDDEAAAYDAERGGVPRACAAAAALHGLLPASCTVLDVGVGTGIVAAELRAWGHAVVGVDLSAGMLAHAVARLPGAVARADVGFLPVRSGSVDAVTAVWLLHLLEDSEPVIAEAARVLRPGGWLLTTVDKSAANEVAEGQAPQYRADGCAYLTAVAARHGLRLAAAATFVGKGQTGEPLYPILGFRRDTEKL